MVKNVSKEKKYHLFWSINGIPLSRNFDTKAEMFKHGDMLINSSEKKDYIRYYEMTIYYEELRNE